MNASALELRIPPPVVGLLLAGAVGVWAWPGHVAPAWDGPRGALTLLLLATGLAFDIAGLLAFHAARTTVNPMAPQRSSALVTGGVYRLTRNPMYVGMVLLLSAWGLWLGALAGVLGPVGFIAYITRFQILPEERLLAARFGGAFADYTARVRRWL
jgi:protein-S-isoprenylcysteine O-methyltransferase Ste14